MKLRSRTRPGFTLVEMIVVIVMMSILAAAGLIGFGAMVSHFREQACYASRREAAQEFVSEWMEGDIPDPEHLDWDGWLTNYRAKNQTEHGDKWNVKVRRYGSRYTVSVQCQSHIDEDVELEFGPPPLNG